MRPSGKDGPRVRERARGVRTKSAWLLAVPFLILARPTPAPLALGAILAVMGLLLRGWAAGTIRKDEELTTGGPYGHLRHPLYVGSFIIGLGMGTAGGHWAWPLLVLAYFAAAYRRTVVEEQARLAELFGARYREYAAQVPAVLPRLTRFEKDAGAVFTWGRYARNREWEALVGAAAVFALLVARRSFF
jgi:hypothetical protein